MKRILVVTSDVPFVDGGHTVIARATVRALRECGHEAEILFTPQNRFGRQIQAYLATRLTDVGMDGLGRTIDQVISLRFPSYAVKHPHHVCWLNHRLREYYDLWPRTAADLSRIAKVKEGTRRAFIRAVDTHLLKHGVSRLYAQSKTVQDRLMRWGRIPSEVLYPPPPQRAYRQEAPGDYIYAVSRLQKLKRLDLLVEAFRHVRNTSIKARIAGQGQEFDSLKSLIQGYGLEGRIALTGEADEKTLISGYAGCLAVFFSPYHEDYGFVTPEAFASAKPVITASDSGGPAELVRDGETGFVVEPTPENIARRIDELADNRAMAEKMGRAAFERAAAMTWDKTVEKLLV